MNKKLKTLIAVVMTLVMTTGVAITSFASTPKYKPLSEYGYTGVPDINVTIPDEYSDGIDKAIKDSIAENGSIDVSDSCSDYESIIKKPDVELVKNEFNSNGERHIKIRWNNICGADEYKIYISDNDKFDNATIKKRLPKMGTYWNFVLKDNVDYYIVVVPVFIVGKYNDKYVTIHGMFSNTITAEQLDK